MAELKELYLKVINQQSTTIEDLTELIGQISEKMNLNVDISKTVQAILGGLPILDCIIEIIEKNPTKMGFQVIKIYDKASQYTMGRKLLKIICHDI